ncbi:MAG: DUF4126 domain-containing protein [Actinobacteria bacterium]|jgi:hypothetical protein|nr:DUF4126 domain-containing protein [Actinomycetota bacterium]
MESVIPLAFTASWASGINPYLLVFLAGLLGRFTGAEVPPGFERMDVLVIFGVLVVIDAIADKVMLVDSAWDVVNTAIRPIAGAVVAVLIVTPDVDLPTAAVAAAGGTVALITHLAKATTRLAVNTSPEPASNVVVSVAEDVAVCGVVLVAVVNPWVAAAIALVLLTVAVVVAIIVARAARRGIRRVRQWGVAES